MSTTTFRRIASALALILAVAGCGGGDNMAGGGTGGTGVSFGTVTDLGSVFVNGVEFSTTGATIRRDDVFIGESQLRRGMTVEVQGTISNSVSGSATSVEVEEAARGRVESRTGTASAGTLVVLGQTVLVDDTTLFDNVTFGSINVGDLLEVHGLRRANGDIAASFIEPKTAPVVFSVRGTVTSHNAAAQTFTIGALTVNYAGAVINNMPAPSGSNWNGIFVEVKGNTCAGNPVCGTLTATKVEPEGLGMANAARAEIEGFVTALVSTSDFTVNSQRVVTTGSTVFAGGLQSEIAVGVKLEVEGSLAGGVLTATKVKFKESVRLESNATVVGSTLTLAGLTGISVTANTFTDLKGNPNLASFNNRNVRIRGRASGATSVIATEIEDRGPSNASADVILQGVATNVSNPTFMILGVTVDTSGLGANNFKDVNDNPIGQAAFFSALSANGVLVKAKGKLPGALAVGSLEEVELED